MNIHNPRGSALYIVIIFTVITFTTASVYLYAQLRLSLSPLKDPHRLQALLNARTGIWYGLALLDMQMKKNASMESDTLTPQALFGEDMFENEHFFDDQHSDDINDTANNAITLEPGVPVDIFPFDSALFGKSTLCLQPSGAYRVLESEGIFKKMHQKIHALIASQPFTSSDTVAYLDAPGMPQGSGMIQGRIAFIEKRIDNSDSLMHKRFHVDQEELRNVVSQYQETLNGLRDSGVLNPPLLIQFNDELASIPDTVRGPLFIDGSRRDIEWKEERTIYVLEQLQLTSKVSIEQVNFCVYGDIQILDQAQITSSEIFSSKLIVFSDDARFQGTAISNGSIEVLKNAYIDGKSIIINTGLSQENDKAEKGKQPSPNSQLKPFTTFIRNEAVIDGIVIDLNKTGGIYTGIETIVNGVLWAQARLCHQGRMKGVVKAAVLVDEQDPLNVTRNVINGSIRELDDIASYFFPYYFGDPTIVQWIEE